MVVISFLKRSPIRVLLASLRKWANEFLWQLFGSLLSHIYWLSRSWEHMPRVGALKPMMLMQRARISAIEIIIRSRQ